MHKDSHIIESLGGAKKLAALLGIQKESGAIQRICNWKKRGIPARILLEHKKLFSKRCKPAPPKKLGDGNA